jgi:hypothetical protein
MACPTSMLRRELSRASLHHCERSYGFEHHPDASAVSEIVTVARTNPQQALKQRFYDKAASHTVQLAGEMTDNELGASRETSSAKGTHRVLNRGNREQDTSEDGGIGIGNLTIEITIFNDVRHSPIPTNSKAQPRAPPAATLSVVKPK